MLSTVSLKMTRNDFLWQCPPTRPGPPGRPPGRGFSKRLKLVNCRLMPFLNATPLCTTGSRQSSSRKRRASLSGVTVDRIACAAALSVWRRRHPNLQLINKITSLMRENTVFLSGSGLPGASGSAVGGVTPAAQIAFRRLISHDAKHRSHMQEIIFDLYKDDKKDKIFLPKLLKELVEAGIRKDDPRLEQMLKAVKEAELSLGEDASLFEYEHLHLDRETFMNSQMHTANELSAKAEEMQAETENQTNNRKMKDMYIDKQLFMKCVGNSIGVIGKTLKNELVIPDWPAFTSVIEEIFEEVRPCSDGQLATYIPQLARADPNSWAVSVCTIDGQRRSWGDAFKPFCLQSVSKPFTYALVHDEIGPDELHSHIGQEPSGRLFNDISLDHNKKPHNPLINAGAIIVASLMKRQASLSDRFDFAIHQMRRFCGKGGYLGFNNAVACRDALSLMYSCGMYDWSGQFAFRVGLPAKSGVSGDMIIVIPNVMGIAIYSPRLDSLGNTVRGVRLAEALIQRFNFHNYDSLVYSDCQKIDPRKIESYKEQDNTMKLMYAAKIGDILAVKRYLLMGKNIHDHDYDDRTALHIAACEGNDSCLDFILSTWKESPEPADRYGRTPLDDARQFCHAECAKLLEEAIEKWRIAGQD